MSEAICARRWGRDLLSDFQHMITAPALAITVAVVASLYGCMPQCSTTSAPVHDFHQERCENGDGSNCAQLAFALEYGRWERGVDLDQALFYYEKGCDMKTALACNGAAEFLTKRAQPGDMERAASYWAEACEFGRPSSCFELSKVLESGAGVGVDAALATTYRERACALGHKPACEH